MANVTVFKDCFFSIDGTDFSNQVRQVTVAYSAETLDKTAMTDGTRIRTGGLKDWTFDLDMYNDANALDAKLFSIVGSSTIALIVRPTTAAASTSNPQLSGTAYLESYNPLAGTVGELMMTPARFLAASDLTRTP